MNVYAGGVEIEKEEDQDDDEDMGETGEDESDGEDEGTGETDENEEDEDDASGDVGDGKPTYMGTIQIGQKVDVSLDAGESIKYEFNPDIAGGYLVTAKGGDLDIGVYTNKTGYKEISDYGESEYKESEVTALIKYYNLGAWIYYLRVSNASAAGEKASGEISIMQGSVEEALPDHAYAYMSRGGYVIYIGEKGLYYDDDDFLDDDRSSVYNADKNNKDTVVGNGNTYERNGYGYGTGADSDHSDYTVDFHYAPDGYYSGYQLSIKLQGSNSLKVGDTEKVFPAVLETSFHEGRETRYVSNNEIGTATVRSVKAWNNEQGGELSVGRRYTPNIEAGHSVDYYFTPSSTGKYSIATKGDGYVWNVGKFNLGGTWDTHTSMEQLSFDEHRDEDGDLRSETYWDNGSIMSQSITLEAGYTYMFHISDHNINDNQNDEKSGTQVVLFSGTTIDTSLFTNSSSRGTRNSDSRNDSGSRNSSNTGNNGSSSTGNTPASQGNRNYSGGGSSSGGSGGSSYGKGDTRTTGKGSSRADYVKTGKDTVRYDVSGVSTKAKTVVIPSVAKINGTIYKVTTISPKAFANKTNLKNVTIGKNIKIIGAGAFNGCKNLKTLTVNSRNLTKKSVKNALKGSSVKTVRAPKNKVSAYKKAFAKSNSGSRGKVAVKAKAKK